MPEPLTRVLEPVTVSHLDCEDSIERVTASPAPGPAPGPTAGQSAGPRPILRPPPPRQATTAPVRAPPSAIPRAAAAPSRLEDVPRAPELPRGVRHSSLEGDPGVLGPVVWGLRCHRLTSAGTLENKPQIRNQTA